jgi:hypothetical protein
VGEDDEGDAGSSVGSAGFGHGNGLAVSVAASVVSVFPQAESGTTAVKNRLRINVRIDSSRPGTRWKRASANYRLADIKDTAHLHLKEEYMPDEKQQEKAFIGDPGLGTDDCGVRSVRLGRCERGRIR